jgi:hypothetical protein
MKSIQQYREEIKAWGDEAIHEWGLIAVVFLVALISFGLGRLSAVEEVRPPVAIGQAATTTRPAAVVMGGLVVASRAGSVYYYPWCSGAQKILPANQQWFSSEQAAQQQGYTAAKACKGLAN